MQTNPWCKQAQRSNKFILQTEPCDKLNPSYKQNQATDSCYQQTQATDSCYQQTQATSRPGLYTRQQSNHLDGYPLHGFVHTPPTHPPAQPTTLLLASQRFFPPLLSSLVVPTDGSILQHHYRKITIYIRNSAATQTIICCKYNNRFKHERGRCTLCSLACDPAIVAPAPTTPIVYSTFGL